MKYNIQYLMTLNLYDTRCTNKTMTTWRVDLFRPVSVDDVGIGTLTICSLGDNTLIKFSTFMCVWQSSCWPFLIMVKCICQAYGKYTYVHKFNPRCRLCVFWWRKKPQHNSGKLFVIVGAYTSQKRGGGRGGGGVTTACDVISIKHATACFTWLEYFS